MKQALTALALALLLGLSACSGGESTAPAAYDPAATSKALLDSGADDETVLKAMSDAIAHKPAAHHFTEGRVALDEKRNMNQTGG